eukprot:6209411-Pleurochrysis_carterae.AAC.1
MVFARSLSERRGQKLSRPVVSYWLANTHSLPVHAYIYAHVRTCAKSLARALGLKHSHVNARGRMCTYAVRKQPLRLDRCGSEGRLSINSFLAPSSKLAAKVDLVHKAVWRQKRFGAKTSSGAMSVVARVERVGGSSATRSTPRRSSA